MGPSPRYKFNEGELLDYDARMRNPRNTLDPNWFVRMQYDPLRLLAIRLRLPHREGEIVNWSPIEHIHVHVSDVKAFVMFVKDDASTTLEDDAKLYPSDRLLAQIKLVMGI
jgi:hypothetical protein